MGRWWSSCCTTRRRCGSGPAALRARRDGDLRALPAALLRARPRARGAARDWTRPTEYRSATCRTTRRLGPARSPMRGDHDRKARGGSRVGERFEAVVGPVAHGGHCIRPASRSTPSPGWCSSGTRSRVSGSSWRSPRAPTATGSGAATRWRSSRRRRTGSSRRARTPAPTAAAAATGSVALPRQRRAQGAVVREQLSRLAATDIHVEVGRPRRRGGAALAAASSGPFGPATGQRAAQAPLARGRPGRRLPDHRGAGTRCWPWPGRDRLDRHRAALSTVVGRRVVSRLPATTSSRSGRRFWQVHPGAVAGRWSKQSWTCSPRAAATFECWTSYHGSVCSRSFGPPTRSASPAALLPSTVGRTAGRPAAGANLAGSPGVVVDARRGRPRPSPRSCPRRSRADPGRAGPAAGRARALVVEQIVDAAAARHRHVACDPRPSPATVATFRKFATGSALAAGLRAMFP